MGHDCRIVPACVHGSRKIRSLNSFLPLVFECHMCSSILSSRLLLLSIAKVDSLPTRGFV